MKNSFTMMVVKRYWIVVMTFIRVFINADNQSVTLSNLPCAEKDDCVVPEGATWILSHDLTVSTLTVHGTLKWDTSKDNLVLRTGYLLVKPTGHLQVGTVASPMERRATIYITKNSFRDENCGRRFICSWGGGRIEIHGRELLRTWTLLSRTATAGSTVIFPKESPEFMRWRPGDRIGLATTTRGRSTVHTIDAIGPATELPLPLKDAYAAIEHPELHEQAIRAIDGNMHTRWSSFCGSKCNAEDQWLAINLPRNSYVTRLRVHFSQTRFSPLFSVQIQELGSRDWLTAHSVTNGQAGWNDVTVARDAVALRIFGDFNSMKSRSGEPAFAGMGIEEVEVFGREHGMPMPTGLHLREPLEHDFWGGFREIGGKLFEMASEVVNLERSVLITGDHDDFETSLEGLHTLQGFGGVMDIRYARVEYCGQRDIMGRYCFHFHMMGNCPDCILKGNAVFDSQQIGITIHGTHHSSVDSNVVWDARAVGIYTEDGNEMHNVIQNNAIICSWWEKCSVTWLGNVNQVAGIFLIGMTNDLIGNHVAGHENCVWTNGAARASGHGAALNRVCTMHAPFGRIAGNVNHDCHRFGFYPDNQHPRKLQRDSDGFVTDMSSCGEFTAEGKDNGVDPANLVEDEFDWHNMFVGAYHMGDVRFERFTSVNNNAPLYWKTSKNFADGGWEHIKDAVFANDPGDYGGLSLLAPNGAFTFGMKNVTFIGGPTLGGALKVGQHCGRAGAGSPCNGVYHLENVDFSSVAEGESYVKFGVNELDPGALVLPVLTSTDNSLGGFRSVVTQYLNGFASIAGCRAAGPLWENGYGCSIPIRRLNLWSADLGKLTISGPGYSAEPILKEPTYGMNAGVMLYSSLHGGYGAPVVAGEQYSVGGALHGDEIFEFSDVNLVRHLGTSESVHLSVGSSTCVLNASAKRDFVSSYGPKKGAYLPEMGCREVQPTVPPRPKPSPTHQPTPRPTPRPILGCDEPCTLWGASHTCRARINHLRNKGHPIHDAIVVVTDECKGACVCEESDFSSPTPSPQQTCTADCMLHEDIATCHDRVKWLQNHKGLPLHSAVFDVNLECSGQCGCTESNFPSSVSWVPLTCGALQLKEGKRTEFRGVTIREDGGVAKCKDCAGRCWLQGIQCVGFVFKAYEGSDTGTCTYYSSIVDSIPSNDAVSVTLLQSFDSIMV
eukprot:TRINITY_DN2292_c0_g1_i5.p1 TRINITY_DN2292_c0_g1~~TRINITY_DN2292_c0_g1_i5.p1  ORF type:complete len:1175 (-),score=137.28 TRINITY_DN2292_c0_g1_i5:107-3631(-)